VEEGVWGGFALEFDEAVAATHLERAYIGTILALQKTK